MIEPMERNAVFDTSGRYRYSLTRRWAHGGQRAAFVLLNPSTADAARDDPTIRRCISFARSWRYNELEVVNLFAFRATLPRDLRQARNPVGPDNDAFLLRAVDAAHLVLLAWGIHGTLAGRAAQALALMKGRDLRCLGETRDGHPRHVLYLPKHLEPVAFHGNLDTQGSGQPCFDHGASIMGPEGRGTTE
jgi:hypothetical protein